MTKDSGITLIELLCCLTIISVLSVNSLQIYSMLRESAYSAARDKLIHDSQTSLEAGKSNYDKSSGDWFWVQSDSAAEIKGWRWGMDGGEELSGDNLLPGLKVKSDTRMTASWNTWCNPANMPWCSPADKCCITENILAWHCKGGKTKWTMTWNTGETEVFEWNNFGCPA